MSFSIITHMAWNFFLLYFNVYSRLQFGCLDDLQFHTLGTNKQKVLSQDLLGRHGSFLE